MTKKKTLKVAKDFRGSTESRLAVDKIKETDKIKRSIENVKTEAGFVQVLQDLVDLMVNNSGMKMSPAQTLSAIDRVKRSFQVEEGPMRDLRALIRETLLLESEPATTQTQGTKPAVTGQKEKETEGEGEKPPTARQEQMGDAVERAKNTPPGKKINKIIGAGQGNRTASKEVLGTFVSGFVPDGMKSGDFRNIFTGIVRDQTKKMEKNEKENDRKEGQNSPEDSGNNNNDSQGLNLARLKNLPK
jgi:hypothetical protein